MDYTTLTLAQLVRYYSDYHKSFYGFRPLYEAYDRTREQVMVAIESIDTAFNKAKETEEGRRQLREDGWVWED